MAAVLPMKMPDRQLHSILSKCFEYRCRGLGTFHYNTWGQLHFS